MLVIKKWSIGILLLWSSLCFAKLPIVPLIGVELGYTRQKLTFQDRITAPSIPTPITTPLDYRNRFSDKGSLFGALLGVQWHDDRWLVGLEGNVNFQDFHKVHPLNFSAPNNAFTVNALYRRGPIYGLSGRLGYFVTSFFMPYIRLGAQSTHVDVTYQAINNVGSPFLTRRDSIGHSKTVKGFVGAIGMEFPLLGPSTLRVEYQYTKTDPIEINDVTGFILGEHSFRQIRTDSVKVGWIWNFL